MGKTKIKTIDDTAQVEEAPKKKLGRQDELVEKLKAELGFEDSGSVIASRRKSSGLSSTKQSTKQKGIATESLDKLETPRNDKVQKPGKSKPRSKKYQESLKDLDKSKTYSLIEAVDLVKKSSYSKFTGTLEAHINTAQMNIRGLVSLPYASGKKLRILGFGKGAENSGADIFGSDEVIEEINKGKINFDLVITTTEWMPKLAKVARILGPRGLIPNPKSGTITTDLKKTVESFQSGKTEYKTEPKTPVIHLGLGKLNQPTEELSANIKTLLQTLGKTRVKKVALSPTMGPSVKLDLASL